MEIKKIMEGSKVVRLVKDDDAVAIYVEKNGLEYMLQINIDSIATYDPVPPDLIYDLREIKK